MSYSPRRAPARTSGARTAAISAGLGSFTWMSALSLTLSAAAAVTQAGTNWRMFVTGDTQGTGVSNPINREILSELAAQILYEQPDVALICGDLVCGFSTDEVLAGELIDWLATMQPVYDAGIQVLVVRGNHEAANSVLVWNAIFSGAYALPANGPASEINVTYSLAYKNALIVGLDDYLDHLHRVNQGWLDAALTGNSRPHVFVFGHEPAYKAFHSTCLGMFPADRDRFWASLAAAGARVYFCGHDHFYNHARIDDLDGDAHNDLHQLIVGTGGGDFQYFGGVYDGDNGNMVPLKLYHVEDRHGYVLVDVGGLRVTLTWMERVGENDYVAAEVWNYVVPPRPGDLNCDSAVDNFDINPFVLALTNPQAYHGLHGGCDIMTADCNGDGVIDNFDVNPFVALLAGGREAGGAAGR